MKEEEKQLIKEPFYCYREEVKGYRCCDCCSLKGKCLFISKIEDYE
jgi:hypothetical protein